ncbi:menaquinol oxidoreductase [candidate division GN15 bacterium]|nr:menaquinol oxidoreductase [candidate division GN15 bacterium]
MRALFSLFAVAVIIVVVVLAVTTDAGRLFFGTILPYAAIAIFLVGMVYRVIDWARSPVPFKITTTSGQQRSLPWIRNSNLESPRNKWGVLGRMLLEVLFFRSLFRNTKADLKDGPRLVYGDAKWLWLAGLIFHWSFLIIFIRHFKFFVEPVPGWVMMIQNLDGFFQVGLPIFYITDGLILAALTFLFLRRVLIPQMRYISLAGDYFPLFVIGGLVISGMIMRYTPLRVDITDAKLMGVGLVTLDPVLPEGLGAIFFVHLTMLTVLLLYFPFSKLTHMAGVFMSPTRNQANDNRVRRHINPWNPEVKVHTYEEWEDEFREVMKAADMPLEKDTESK